MSDKYNSDWLASGGAPDPLRYQIAAMLRRECSASEGDSNFAAALAIDMVRKWIRGEQENVAYIRDPEHPERMPTAHDLDVPTMFRQARGFDEPTA